MIFEQLKLNAVDVADIILGIIFISTFIGIFFFTYGSYMEKKIIDEQLNSIISDMLNISILNDKAKGILYDPLKSMKKPNLEEQDKEAAESNKQLIIKASVVLSLIFIIGMTIVIVLSIVYKFSVLERIGYNLIVLIFIGVIEMAFLTFIGGRYISTDSNFIKKSIINAFEE